MALTKRTDFETNELKGVVLAVDESKIKPGVFVYLSNWKPSGIGSIQKKRGVILLSSTAETPPTPTEDCVIGGGVGAPTAPSLLVATAATDEISISLTWQDNSADETGFEILRSTGTGTTNLIPIDQVIAGITAYNDTNVDPSTTYVYQVRAFNFAGVSTASNSDEATTIAEAVEPPLLDLVAWWDANQLGYADGDPVSVFDDFSVEGNDLIGSDDPESRPIFVADSINGLPAVSFDGTSQFLVNDSLDTGAFTEASIFIVGRLVADPPFASANFTGLWKFNTPDAQTSFPWTDGIIYESVFSTIRKTTLTSAGELTRPFQYNVISGAGTYKVRLNRAEIYSSGVNTFQGQDVQNFLGKSGIYFYQGVIAEVCIFNSALNATDRNLVETYLQLKWNL